MKYLISFLSIFIIMYIFYLVSMVFRKKNKNFNEKKMRVEESYIVTKYKIDMKKIKYRSFLNVIALTNSFIFGVSFAATQVIDKNVFIQIIIGLAIMIPLIIISYDWIGKYYIKKGYIKK